MAQAMRLKLAALVVCAAFVAPAAGRQLKQTGNNLDFPGCSFLSDSEIFRNPDFSALATALQASGLNDTLSNLTGYHTLFAPTDEAFAEFLAAANITAQDALSSNLNEIVLASHVVAGVVPGEILVSTAAAVVLPCQAAIPAGEAKYCPIVKCDCNCLLQQVWSYVGYSNQCLLCRVIWTWSPCPLSWMVLT